ncbi:MAG: DUF4856 domain-containing protein [Pseudomonadota bacterium]
MMIRPRPLTAVCALMLAAGTSNAAMAQSDLYANFPVTLKGYDGDKKSSVAYTGQIARHALHDSLKALAGKGDGGDGAALKQQMISYFSASDAGRKLIAPTSKGEFVILQGDIDSISKKKNLAGKTFKGTIAGMPNNMTGSELVAFWIDKAATTKGGVDTANGYNYPQLISKFIMGAVSYNQAVDNYLDEKLEADNKPNDKPYKKGAYYTGKEHSWDEGFGYFGAPAHALRLSPDQAYSIAKRKDAVVSAADLNGDGKIDLKSEYVFGPAYYAAGSDRSGKTKYFHTIMRAFIDGRQIITDAAGEKLSDTQRAKLKAHAKTIATNWEQVLAEAVYKYAGSVYKDMEQLKAVLEANGDTTKLNNKYIKHWGELKGFALALQTGKTNLGETATKLNRLIGAGPLLINLSQVVDISSKGDYVRDQTISWGEYMLHMAKVQKLMEDAFGVKAKANAISGDIATLAQSLGAGTGAEND